MTQSARQFNFYKQSYEQPDISTALDLLYNQINLKKLNCERTINKVLRKLKINQALIPRKTMLSRLVKLENYKDRCKNINKELSAVIDWVDAECIRMNCEFISLRLYNAIYRILQKVNTSFSHLDDETLEVIGHADEHVWHNWQDHHGEITSIEHDARTGNNDIFQCDNQGFIQARIFQQEQIMELFA